MNQVNYDAMSNAQLKEYFLRHCEDKVVRYRLEINFKRHSKSYLKMTQRHTFTKILVHLSELKLCSPKINFRAVYEVDAKSKKIFETLAGFSR